MKIRKIITTLLMLFSLAVFSQNNKEQENKLPQNSLNIVNAFKTYNENINAFNSMGIFSHLDLCANKNTSVLKSTTNLNSGIDTDGDNVDDEFDLDDDNDGILDTDEGFSNTTGNNLLLNGTFDGPNTNSSTVPAGWQWIPYDSPICQATSPSPNSASPNLTDENGPSTAAGIFGTAQDGTTFMSGLYGLVFTSFQSIVFHEGFQQNVNLTAGVTYTMTFYQAHVGQSNYTDGTGTWKVFIDNQEIFQSEATIPNSSIFNVNLTWTFQSFTFIPTTSGFQEIQFLPFDDDANISSPNGVRVGIDNVVLTDGIAVANEDVDEDTITNNLDVDSDNDGISDLVESGLDVMTYDSDFNGVIDGADFTDTNNNGLADNLEAQYGTNMGITPAESLADMDIKPNFIDLDSDGDTIPDSVEAQLTLGYETSFPNDGNVTDDDSDGDGIIDVYDSLPGHGGNFNPVQNTDSTDLPDYLDSDSDNDMLSDISEVGNVGLDINLDGATDNSEGANGFDDTLETLDNFLDPDGTIVNPSLLPDIDGDVLTGGDVDYRDVFLFAEIIDTTICFGSNGSIVFSGTPNATVSYTVNLGVVQTILLDALGATTITVTMPVTDVTVELISVTLESNSGVLGTNFTIEIIDLPVVNLGNDIVLCEGETTILDATTSNASYLWQDGSTNATLLVTSADTYSVEITVDGCSAIDEIMVNYNPLPIVNLGLDRTVCENETVILDATTQNATYLWQDGSVNPMYTVPSAGTYSVQVTVNGCSTTDSIVISFDTLPIIDLGLDITLCENESVLLVAATEGATYTWQDGSIGQTLSVNSAGIYTVQVTVGACTIEDSIEVIYNTSPQVYMFDLVEACSNVRGDGMFNLFEASPLISGNQNTIAATFYTSFSDAENNVDAILNPEAYTSQSSTVFIRLENLATQCFSVGSFQIDTIDCKIFIPQGFSPNGDMTNETFNIINLDLFSNHTLEIFNRYGTIVYKGNANTPKWDGTYKGDLVTVGTYFYGIKLNNNGTVIKNIKDNYSGWVYVNY